MLSSWKTVMTDPKYPSRRQAIRYLVGGALAAACPIPLPSEIAPVAAASAASHSGTTLGSENNTLCHQVRDGKTFMFPAPYGSDYETVVIGGGPSGLMAAYKLRHLNFILLEKEPRLGGNAISEQWKNQWYSTGAAYQEDNEVGALCREIGMEIHKIRSVDACIVNNSIVPEFWTTGLWKSPYSDSAKKNFARFMTDMKALDLKANEQKLDNMTFAELLKPYGPEVKAWFDNFGPNNWGANTENTSALIGADVVSWVGGIDQERFTWPGGLGRISLALEDAVNKAAAGRMHKGATVLHVEQKESKVLVSYSESGELKTITAKTAIIACPKFI